MMSQGVYEDASTGCFSSLALYADISRHGSSGWRPSDILNLLGLENTVTGCQLGSILEASPSSHTHLKFSLFSYEKFAYYEAPFFLRRLPPLR